MTVRLWLTVVGVVLGVAACTSDAETPAKSPTGSSSDSIPTNQIAYDTPSDEILRQLNLCPNPVPKIATCEYPGRNQAVWVGGFDTADMQRALVPQYRTDPACVLMLRGFYISAVSGDILRRYVDVAAIQAEYGDGELLGEGC